MNSETADIKSSDVRLKFWLADHGYTIDDADEFVVKNFDCYTEMESNLEGAAESYADYFHDCCDGWEYSWPISFTIATMDNKVLGVVSVDREHRPEFCGRIVK